MQPPYQPHPRAGQRADGPAQPGGNAQRGPATPYAQPGWPTPSAPQGPEAPHPQPGWPGGNARQGPVLKAPPFPAAPAQGPVPGQQGYPGHPGPHAPRGPWLPPVLRDPGEWNPARPEVGRPELGLRFVARLIDTILFAVVWYLMMMLGTAISMIVGGGVLEGAAEAVFAGTYVFSFFLLPILLEWLQTLLWGRSVGKIIFGLWVVRADGSGRVTAGRALVRALLYAPGHTNLVNWVLPWSLTNVLWPLRDKTLQRCLHDKAAGTVVVQVRR
ncbi:MULTISPECIES: RDD family protein [unclassified Nocardiopsis]|uniref:RDD family protein n=1 Tax=unclassified Nocardiopsis TaxID=2649073 RepID=UPI00135BF86C|nr:MULTISPECIES: RDD family protein [unclassified Nocardiopsis]